MYLNNRVNAGQGKYVLYADDRQSSAVLINPEYSIEELLNFLRGNQAEYMVHVDLPTPVREPPPPFPLVPTTPPPYEWPRKGPSKKKWKKIPPQKIPPPPTPNDPQNREMKIYLGRNHSLEAILNQATKSL